MTSHEDRPASREHIELVERHSARNYAPLPVVIAGGEGCWVTDVEGRRYLDMLAAYSALNFGHRHPEIVAAAKEQLDRLTLTSRAFHSDQIGPFLRDLSELCDMDMALPMNSGAEAVETAIKIARKWGYRVKGVPSGRAKVVVCDGNFHGRTITIVSFSSDEDSRRDFEPHTPGFVSIPFGDAGMLEAAISPCTAAVHIAPIQGEAGIVVPPGGYLATLRRICDRHGILLIFDEVQSGFGRTGRNFCFEHENARPDGLIVGKALGGGLMPVSAFVARRAVMDVFDPGSHGSTFGGNPLAAAVAREAIRVLQDEDLALRSRVLGKILLAALAGIGHPAIVEVRGKGLWAGVELDPARANAKDVCLAMLRRGVLTKETHETVIRFAPPLIIEEADLLQAVEVFHDALEETATPHAERCLA